MASNELGWLLEISEIGGVLFLYLNLPPPKENMFPSKFVELDLFKGIAMETEVEYLIF